MKSQSTADIQLEMCRRFFVDFFPAPDDQKVGIAENTKTRLRPINGLRHQPTGDTTGWFIWAGEEFSKSPDFFVPLHVAHLDEWCPVVKKYLGLPPGWRFLLADDHEDVWFDKSLLNI